jgi:hypothetical protein
VLRATGALFFRLQASKQVLGLGRRVWAIVVDDKTTTIAITVNLYTT